MTVQLDDEKNTLPIKSAPPEAWPRAAWPERDAWLAAISAGPSYRKAGRAANLSEDTRIFYGTSYAYFLSWLSEGGQLIEGERVEERVTPARLEAYVASMKTHVSLRTVVARAKGLELFLTKILPSRSWAWIRRTKGIPTIAEIRAETDIRQAIDIIALCRAALADIEDVRNRELDFETAVRFRDDLMTIFLCVEPLRKRTLSSLELDRHVVINDGALILDLPGELLKNRKPRIVVLPNWFRPYFLEYLSVYRPLLAGDTGIKALWVNRRGEPLDKVAIPIMTRRIGLRMIGREIAPHEFRYGVTTEILRRDPRDLDMAAAALGHIRYATTSSTYNLNSGAPAVAMWAKVVREYAGQDGEDTDDENQEEADQTSWRPRRRPKRVAGKPGLPTSGLGAAESSDHMSTKTLGDDL